MWAVTLYAEARISRSIPGMVQTTQITRKAGGIKPKPKELTIPDSIGARPTNGFSP
jgi:hypothetical protein